MCFEFNIENVIIITVSVKNENILQENSYPLESIDYYKTANQITSFYTYFAWRITEMSHSTHYLHTLSNPLMDSYFHRGCSTPAKQL